MMNHIEKAGHDAAIVFHDALERVRRSLPLLARMFAVVAMGVAAVHLLNHSAASVVFGGHGDATAFVIGQVKGLTNAALTLVALMHDVFAFFDAP